MNQGFGGWSPQQHNVPIVDTLAADVALSTVTADITSRTLPAGTWKITYVPFVLKGGTTSTIIWAVWDKTNNAAATDFLQGDFSMSSGFAITFSFATIITLPVPTTVTFSAKLDSGTATILKNQSAAGLTGRVGLGSLFIYEQL